MLAAVAEGSTPGPSAGIVAGVVVLAFAVPTVAAVLASRVPRGALVLTPEAVRLRTWNSEREIAWSDIAEIVIVAQPRRTLVIYAASPEAVRVERGPRSVGEQQARSVAGAARALAVSVPHLTGDPGLLLNALQHWQR